MADPMNTATDSELLAIIASDVAYLRAVVSEWAPLLALLRPAVNGDAVRAAGLRRALKRTGRDAT